MIDPRRWTPTAAEAARQALPPHLTMIGQRPHAGPQAVIGATEAGFFAGYCIVRPAEQVR